MARLSWDPGVGLVPGPVPAGRLVRIDSWLVDDGRVRALAKHRTRFLAGRDDDGFFAAVTARLPRTGTWFPRVERYDDDTLAMWLRPAPPLATTTTLWVPPEPDPRRQPTVKGADLDALAALRATAVDAGADDAVLYAADGAVLETAHAALVWWRDGVLCLPENPTLPSVTVALLLEIAERNGVAVARQRCGVDELFCYPLWTVNALHGIRQVTGTPELDLSWWRTELAATAAPMDVLVGGSR